MVGEINLHYVEHIDRLFVRLSDSNGSDFHNYAGASVVTEYGIVVGYVIRNYSERPTLNNYLSRLLGKDFSDMEELNGLA